MPYSNKYCIVIDMKKNIFAFLIIAVLLTALPSGMAEAKTKTNSKSKISTNKKTAAVTWTAAALKELRKTPSFVRAIVKAKITNYAIRHKIKVITPAIVKNTRV